MSYVSTARELVKEYNEKNRGKNGGDFIVEDDSIITCPCGHMIEWDGECPEGHISPIRAMGFI